MTNSVSTAPYNPFYLATASAASAAAAQSTFDSGVADSQPLSPIASSLTQISASSLPAVQMTPAQLAAVQSGSGFKAPDAAKTEAQQNSTAYALIKDSATGQVVGGVWPNAGVVSASNSPIIADDSRITGNTNWSEVSQYLAQDIAQASGRQVTIQYFQPGDPNAPTFADMSSIMGAAG